MRKKILNRRKVSIMSPFWKIATSCLKPDLLRRFLVTAALIAAVFNAIPSAKAAPPCCHITAINAKTGIVTASENATGRAFSFKVTNSTLLHSLKVGQGVYANFATHQVSVNGLEPCCSITALENISTGPTGGAKFGPIDSAKSGGMSNPVTPCCNILSVSRFGPIDSIVTAQVSATGQTFQFKVTSAAMAKSLKVGQAIYANFARKQVSVDGVTPSGNITAIGNTSTGTGIAPQSQPMTAQPPPSSPPDKAKPTSEKRPDAEKNTLGTGATVIQPAEPTTEVANRAATTGPASDPNPNSPQNDKRDLRADNRDIRNDRKDLHQDRKDARKEQQPEAVPPAEPRTEVANRAATAGGSPAPNALTNLPAEKPGTVRPPQLSFLGCTPIQVPSGTPIHCSLRLDTNVPGTLSKNADRQAGAGIEVQVATDRPALATSSTVTLRPGTDKAEFQIPTVADAQGGPIRVSASYQGETKTASLQLTPAAIKSFGCFVGASSLSPSIQGADTCTITPGSGTPYGFIVHLTQAEAQSVSLQLTPSVSWGTPNVLIPAGQSWGGLLFDDVHDSCFRNVPRPEKHTLTLRDPVSGVSYSVDFNVLPASISGVGFGETLASAQNPMTVNSLPGQKLTVWVSFNAPPAPTDWGSQNAWLDEAYGGPVDATRGTVAIQGPTNSAIRVQDCVNNVTGSYCNPHYPVLLSTNIQITVGACSRAENPNGCQATVTVSSNQALGRAVGVINVTPQ